MEPDDKICYCYHVPLRKLWNFAMQRRLQRPSQLSECLGAGTGCGWCIPILKKIFERARDAQGEVPQIDMTPEEYAARRQEYIREKRPRNQF